MRRLTFRLLITAAFLSIAIAPTLAQQQRGPALPAQVHGQVRYAQGGTPAFNILVQIEKFSGGVVAQETTDRNGRFNFSGLTREQFYVKVHMPGYKDVQQWIELNTNLSQYVLLTLETDGTSARPAIAHTVNGSLIDANASHKAQEEFTKGRAAFDNDKPEEGIAHLEKAIKMSPNFLEAHLLLGAAYLDVRQLDKAESALRKALEINSKKPEAYFELGEVYRQQKKYIEAEKVLREGLKIDNRSWQGRYTLGRVYWDMSDIMKAAPQIALALQLKPDLAEAYLLAGNILLRARKNEDALLEFEEYLRLAPQGKFSGQTRELVQKIKEALAEKKKR
jgi:tetratricopeptide (TPR) repeat protein